MEEKSQAGQIRAPAIVAVRQQQVSRVVQMGSACILPYMPSALAGSVALLWLLCCQRLSSIDPNSQVRHVDSELDIISPLILSCYFGDTPTNS